jgi:peptide/nickel transport system substrate-binding protein
VPPGADVGAVLRLGEHLGSPTFRPVFDPIATQRGDDHYLFYVYDTLLREKLDGTFAPALALGAQVVDPSTITVTLRPNLRFQDGTPLDAEAVKFTILRNQASGNIVAFEQMLLQEVASIEAPSPTELTIRLAKPIAASFFHLLAHCETSPVSPTAVRAGKDLRVEPVGAGPFRLVSQSDSLVRLEKWSGYYGADDVHFAGIDIVDVATPEQQVEALATGAVDLVHRLQFVSLGELRDAPVTVTMLEASKVGFDHVWLHRRGNPDLLGDVRVRQALIYATDRAEVNELLYGGRSEIQTQWVPPGHPAYDPTLVDLYRYDVDKARALLAEAGRSDLKVTMTRQSVTGGRLAGILAQQWSRAGITVEVVPTNDPGQDFYVTGKYPLLAFSGGAAFWWTDVFTRFLAPSALTVALCPPTDPSYPGDLDTLQTLDPDSREAHVLFQKVTRTVLEEACFVPVTQAPNGTAWSNRMGEVTLRQNSTGYLFPDFFGTHIAIG